MNKEKIKEALSPRERFFFDDIMLAKEMAEDFNTEEKNRNADFDCLYGTLE